MKLWTTAVSCLQDQASQGMQNVFNPIMASQAMVTVPFAGKAKCFYE